MEGGEFLMHNVTLEVKDNILTVTVDLSKSFGRSVSGKSITVATTAGAVPVEGVLVNLNVYKK